MIKEFRIYLRISLTAILLLVLPNNLQAQRDLKSESVFTPIYGLTYKASLPGGDFAKRWGFSNALGAEINFKLKSNWSFGLESQFLFGNSFKELSIFDNLINEDGNITNLEGNQGDVLFLLRGANFTGQIGYVFTQVGKGPNAGLWVNGGIGFQMHKIRIEHTYDELPQLEDSYLKGYDKLAMGIVTKQFIGYLQQGNRKYLDFYGGFEFTQGFNKNVRTFNFDTEGPENELRFDLFYGLKIGWMIPIYKRQLQEYYYD
ncbi:MAG: hypothetical protein AB8B74_07285 [Crocinitomicaceae bacterium]